MSYPKVNLCLWPSASLFPEKSLWMQMNITGIHWNQHETDQARAMAYDQLHHLHFSQAKKVVFRTMVQQICFHDHGHVYGLYTFK